MAALRRFATVAAAVTVALEDTVVAAAGTTTASSPWPPSGVRARVVATFAAALAGDALSLGAHYEYDAAVIAARVGRYERFHAPGEGLGGTTHGVGWGRANYHPGKVAGDLTDAGDVSIMLLEHLAETRGVYSFDGYAAHWLDRIRRGYGSCNFQTALEGGVCPPGTTPGYISGASRRTLAALEQEPDAKGERRKALAAPVNCLQPATRFLPLLYVLDTEDALAAAAVSSVYLTHRDRDPVKAADFLARALFRRVRGESLKAALEGAAAKTNDALVSKWLQSAQDKVREANDPSSDLSKETFVDDRAITSMARLWDVGKSEPIRVGKASPVEGALPGALYIALRYESSLEEALIANAGVGGDNAARGFLIGALLGSGEGTAASVPLRWAQKLNEGPRVAKLWALVEGAGAGGGGGGVLKGEL
jgi:hypothetical protein